MRGSSTQSISIGAILHRIDDEATGQPMAKRLAGLPAACRQIDQSTTTKQPCLSVRSFIRLRSNSRVPSAYPWPVSSIPAVILGNCPTRSSNAVASNGAVVAAAVAVCFVRPTGACDCHTARYDWARSVASCSADLETGRAPSANDYPIAVSSSISWCQRWRQ